MYPNSATRKLYGQVGKALQRQNKRFQNYQQQEREKRITSEKELKRIQSEREVEFKRIQRKERIISAIVAGVIVLSLVAYFLL